VPALALVGPGAFTRASVPDPPRSEPASVQQCVQQCGSAAVCTTAAARVAEPQSSCDPLAEAELSSCARPNAAYQYRLSAACIPQDVTQCVPGAVEGWACACA